MFTQQLYMMEYQLQYSLEGPDIGNETNTLAAQLRKGQLIRKFLECWKKTRDKGERRVWSKRSAYEHSSLTACYLNQRLPPNALSAYCPFLLRDSYSYPH